MGLTSAIVLFGCIALAYSQECPGMVSTSCFHDYFKDNLDPVYVGFYDSGSTRGITVSDNSVAFTRFNLIPRLLQDVSKRDTSTMILGLTMSFPVGIEPTSAQMMAHPEGEIGTAKGAAAADTLMILGTHSTVSMEDVAMNVKGGVRWFQLYVQKDKKMTEELVKRAQAANYKAIVVSVDTPVNPISWENRHNNFTFPSTMKLANFKFSASNNMDELEYARSLIDSSLTWDVISWLKGITSLPIVVKGVLTPRDAKLAVSKGASGIIVSNHGGRALDGTPATIDVLKEVVEAVGKQVPVMLDGGIRTGNDVVKALALGAKFVFTGKPSMWGLSYQGAKGVKCVLDILKAEFDNAMALVGAAKVSEINADMVIEAKYKAFSDKIWDM